MYAGRLEAAAVPNCPPEGLYGFGETTGGAEAMGATGPEDIVYVDEESGYLTSEDPYVEDKLVPLDTTTVDGGSGNTLLP